MNKVAVITGASGGLGQALAKKLLAEQWELILVGRDADKLKSAYGDSHTQIIADCSQVSSAQYVFEEIRHQQLMPTALVHA